MPVSLRLNERASRLADHAAQNADVLRIAPASLACGTRVIDCGIRATGSLQAGLILARLCLANLAEVSLFEGEVNGFRSPLVQVATDWPVAACLASQYAGWQLDVGNYSAIGSGPMRAAAGREPLFDRIGCRESPAMAVGVLETRQLPDDAVAAYLSACTRVPPEKITLLAAPAASIAGTIQVVARSVETALHKLHELGFDVQRVRSAVGTAPLPPMAADELQAIGRTNDAILYGGRVRLWVTGDDDSLAEIGPRVPAAASTDYGQPFAAIFTRYGQDFYRIDPMLFSPAAVSFHNLDTGRTHEFGRLDPDVLRRSFQGSR